MVALLILGLLAALCLAGRVLAQEQPGPDLGPRITHDGHRSAGPASPSSALAFANPLYAFAARALVLAVCLPDRGSLAGIPPGVPVQISSIGQADILDRIYQGFFQIVFV